MAVRKVATFKFVYHLEPSVEHFHEMPLYSFQKSSAEWRQQLCGRTDRYLQRFVPIQGPRTWGNTKNSTVWIVSMAAVPTGTYLQFFPCREMKAWMLHSCNYLILLLNLVAKDSMRPECEHLQTCHSAMHTKKGTLLELCFAPTFHLRNHNVCNHVTMSYREFASLIHC